MRPVPHITPPTLEIMQSLPLPSWCDRARLNVLRFRRSLLASVLLVGALAFCAASLGCARVNGDGGTGGVLGTGGNPVFQGAGGEAMDAGKFTSDASQGETVSCNGGDACMCPPFKLAVMGKPGKWGANPGGDPDAALQSWLNSSSAGTAQVDNFANRTPLTAEFLAKYNVIILAGLGDDSNNGPWWTFSSDEIAAFRAWVENGGGVITLSGYSGNSAEITPVNQLIGFSGITYTQDTVSGTCADAQTCNCTHCNTLSDWNRTDPVVAQLATGMTLVGMASGRGIVVPSDGHVAATAGGSPALVGKVVGAGRVLVYTDERQRSQLRGTPSAGQVPDRAVLVQPHPLVAAGSRVLHDHRAQHRRVAPVSAADTGSS